MNLDQGILKQLLYEPTVLPINQEAYVKFFYFLPHDDSPSDWIIFGTTVHFWGPPPRDTLVAIIDKNRMVKSVQPIPFEFLVNNEAINDLSYQELYENYTLPLFDIQQNDSLLVMQGTPQSASDLYPSIIEGSPSIADANLIIEGVELDLSFVPIGGFQENSYMNSFEEANWFNSKEITFEGIDRDFSGVDGQVRLSQSDYYPGMSSYIPVNITREVHSELVPNIIWGDSEHWIPNTNELSDPFEVKIHKKNFINNQNDSCVGDSIKFDTFEDPSWAMDPNANSNVFANKGTGFKVYAVFQDENVRVAEFLANGTKFYTQLHSINLSVGPEGKLYYKNDDYITTTKFKIEATGTIRPGDDIIPSFTTVSCGGLEGTVPIEDFFAVYDKQLLERARAFMAFDGFKRDAAGEVVVNDGNNVSYTESEYQKADDDVRDQWRSTTLINNWTNKGGDIVADSVAYNNGGCDTVGVFNNKLNQQRDSIQFYYNNNNPIWTEANPNLHIDWANHDSTKAPGDNWNNYLSHEHLIEINPVHDTWNELNRYKSIEGNNTGDYPVGNFPYRPVLGDHDATEDKNSARFSGLDCIHFIQLAAAEHSAFGGNGNLWSVGAHYNEPSGYEPWWNSTGTPPSPLNAWSIYKTSKSGAELDGTIYSRNIIDIDLIVPGDVIVRDDHIGIVDRITTARGSRTESSFYIIEATWGNNSDHRRVISERTWEELNESGLFSVRRLIP